MDETSNAGHDMCRSDFGGAPEVRCPAGYRPKSRARTPFFW